MMLEALADDRPSLEPTFEVDTAKLEEILQPDEVLAAQQLDAAIQEAEADPQTDADALVLLRFQRSMVDMEPRDARMAAMSFVRETGKYATFSHTFGKSLPSLHYEVNRSLIVPRSADTQRWKILGIDPTQYGDDGYARAYKNGMEASWQDAIKARQNLKDAQAAEAQAMERVTHPPVFVPEPEK